MRLLIFSSTGIGRAVVKALAQCGAEVIAFSRTQADLDSLKNEVRSGTLLSCIHMCVNLHVVQIIGT